jgi:antitoxin ParD1/3/4
MAIFAINGTIERPLEQIMATMNVSLPDAMKQWVDRQSVEGRYSNASDYVRDLIRRDQARQDAVAVLQQAVMEGLKSGPGRGLDVAEFKRTMREKKLAE